MELYSLKENETHSSYSLHWKHYCNYWLLCSSKCRCFNRGVILRLIGNSICLPWAIKNKVWDFVGLLGFFLALELHKFLGMVFGS
jgi:hypothetical protein